MFSVVPTPCSHCAGGYCRVIAPTEVPQSLSTPQLQAQGSAYGLTTRPDACALWGVTGCHPKGDLHHNTVQVTKYLHPREQMQGCLHRTGLRLESLDQKSTYQS